MLSKSRSLSLPGNKSFTGLPLASVEFLLNNTKHAAMKLVIWTSIPCDTEQTREVLHSDTKKNLKRDLSIPARKFSTFSRTGKHFKRYLKNAETTGIWSTREQSGRRQERERSAQIEKFKTGVSAGKGITSFAFHISYAFHTVIDWLDMDNFWKRWSQR